MRTGITVPLRPAGNIREVTARAKLLSWAAVMLAAALFLGLFQNILLPFVAGLAIAYFLDPIVDRLEGSGIGRTAGAALALVGFALAVAGVFLLLAPVIHAQLTGLIRNLPQYAEAIETHAGRLMAVVETRVTPEELSGLRKALVGQLGSAATWVGRLAGDMLGSGIALFNLIGLLVLTPVVAFYLLRDWNKLLAGVDALLPRGQAATIREQAGRIDRVLAGFVRGQASVCAALGLGYGTALMAAGLDFGFVVGLVSGLISFVPYIGSVVGGVISIGLALDQFDSWWRVGLVAAIYATGQVLEGNYLTPKFVGDRIGLHPVWVIFALLAGGSLLGLVGMLVALPAAAAVGVLVRFAAERYRTSRFYDADCGDDAG